MKRVTVWYIVANGEVVDQFDTSAEAVAMLPEYRMAYGPTFKIDVV
jgi:hypothetical protein